MTFGSWNTLRRLVCAAGLGFTLVAPAAPPVARKLNGPLPRVQVADVRDFQLVPGQERVVYVADQDTDEVFELYTRALGRGARAVRLHPPLSASDDIECFLIDAQGRRIVFFVRNPFVGSLFHVYSAPADGSAPPIVIAPLFFGLPKQMALTQDGSRLLYSRLHPGKLECLLLDRTAPPVTLSPVGPPGVTALFDEFRIAPGGTHVVFTGSLLIPDRVDLFSAPVDGSAPAIHLNAVGNIIGVTAFALTPDGQSVVFRAQRRSDAEQNLYLVPLDGTAAPVQLTPNLPNIRHVEDFQLSPNGARLVYRADHDTLGLQELYALTLAAPHQVVRLNGPLVAGGEVAPGFQIAPDGARIVYLADEALDEQTELFAAPIDGGAAAVRLHAPLGPGEAITRFELAADSAHAVFTRSGTQVELFGARIDGSGAERLVPQLVPDGDVVRFELAGGRVVYRADQDTDEVLELFSAPIDAHAPAVRLHAPLAPGQSVLPEFRIAADARAVAFLADLDLAGCFELHHVAVDGSAPPVRASDPALGRGTPVGDVLAALPAGERVVYRADQHTDEVFELFSVPRDGSRAAIRLHAPPVSGGDVDAFEIGAGGGRVLFSGDFATDGLSGLYSVPADGSAPPVDLVGPLVAGGSIRSRALSPDGAWVVFTADALRDEQVELYAVALDGSTPPLRLDPAPHRNFGDVGWFVIAPDSRSVVYASDKDRRGRAELYSVALDGRAPAVRLSAVTAPGGDVQAARFTPDSAFVVYRADQDLNDVEELYTVPASGGVLPVKLHAPLAGQHDVAEFALGAGNRVVFELGLPGRTELYSVAVDGSAPAAAYFAPGRQTFEFWTTPGGTRVVTRTYDAAHELQLFAAPIDGGTPPVRLAGPLPPWGYPVLPLFPDEETMLFYTSDIGEPGTYRVRLDGSVPPVKLDDSGFPVQLSADGSLLLLGGDFDVLKEDVFVMPTDGSAPARRIHPPLGIGGSVSWAGFAPGNDVLFISERERGTAQELFVSASPFAPGRAQDPAPAPVSAGR